MSSLVVKISEIMASDVRFDSDMMHVRLLDGREIGIHWDELDEDISAAALLK